MIEYINRQTLIDEVTSVEWQNGVDAAIAMSIVAATPASADVEFIKYGHWVKEEYEHDWGYISSWHCSVCNESIGNINHGYPRCPYCGAKMDVV